MLADLLIAPAVIVIAIVVIGLLLLPLSLLSGLWAGLSARSDRKQAREIDRILEEDERRARP